MTGLEMKEAFLLQYDINGSAAVAGFIDGEIYEFLTKAQLDLIMQIYYTKGPEPIEEVVDNASGSLSQIIFPTWGNNKTYIFNVGGNINEHIPDDFMFYINSRTKLKRTNYPIISGNDVWVDNKIIKYQDIIKFLPNNENRQIFYNPVSYINAGNVSIIVDYFTTPDDGTTSFLMGYVRKPREINDSYNPTLKSFTVTVIVIVSSCAASTSLMGRKTKKNIAIKTTVIIFLGCFITNT